ncbi:hypothetical protein NDS46_29905 (plasmid) [Paenibacillus thiaminolyticus]|uniref:hypothetical protein n=1 Tax=Paenibacillus thiaminolyticus TaxID=49283 RepID=UPI0023301125|nr:hypothetical protein [Paenibacillus thiaminolyticus]WCF11563.1 hypothetical protein NDS46_29905 [Paenibacillus thiaminolyticus]
MDKICGRCSQETGKTIEERINIALSRIPLTVYTCPVCNQEHSLSSIMNTSPADDDLFSPIAESKKHKNQEQEQLLLF